MGVALWLACGLVALILARLIPLGRRAAWLAEMAIALVTASFFGIGATALDFGGWNELDWRACLFVVFGSFAGIGAWRAVQSAKPLGGPS